MSDQCEHCTSRGDWAKCRASECFHHENWGWQQLERENADLKREVETLKLCAAHNAANGKPKTVACELPSKENGYRLIVTAPARFDEAEIFADPVHNLAAILSEIQANLIKDEVVKERDEWRERYEDGEAAYREVMEEACEGGVEYWGSEGHCACVPHLRRAVAEVKRDWERAEADNAALTLEVERLKALAGHALVILRKSRDFYLTGDIFGMSNVIEDLEDATKETP